jgi:hypothetical protein
MTPRIAFVALAALALAGTALSLPDGAALGSASSPWDELEFCTERVTVAYRRGMQPDGPSRTVSISYDGHLVAFSSMARNLVSTEGNDNWDVFVRDWTIGGSGLGNGTRMVSISLKKIGDGGFGAADPAISGDGRFVAYSARAARASAMSPLTCGAPGSIPSHECIVVYDQTTGSLRLVDDTPSRQQSDGASR